MDLNISAFSRKGQNSPAKENIFYFIFPTMVSELFKLCYEKKNCVFAWGRQFFPKQELTLYRQKISSRNAFQNKTMWTNFMCS